jgi:ribosomal protein RSM22 (predicted rRNA methylase)
MTVRQTVSGNRKTGEITLMERNTATQQVESLLKNIKEKAGKVILIQITNRTSIELPAYLSQEERDARVANYIKLHKSKI